MLLAAVASLAAPSISRADETWLLRGEASGAMPLTAPQRDLFGGGAAGALTFARTVGVHFSLGLRLRAVLLEDGPPPVDRRREDPKKGGAFGLGLSLRARLLGRADDSRRSPGPFIDATIGAAQTGDVIRPDLEVSVGWGIDLGPLTLAPVLGYLQVIETSNELDNRDARIGMAGLEVTILDPPRYAPAVPEQQPQAGDQDGDGVLDPDDRCVTDPEDLDGFQDEDGCPDPDNDLDSIPDDRDECRNEAEDRDEFQDEDGCPDADNDWDGILDGADRCPNEPETFNGIDDQDGCPDEAEITFVEDRVVLDERVLFDSERARVKTAARRVLGAIIALWRRHPDWVGMRIEGHSDVRGPASYNSDLSRRRAANVRRALVELGMPDAMIQTEGYGASRPRATEATDEANQRNRRVEFIVVTRRPEVVAPSSGAVPPAARAPANSHPSVDPENDPTAGVEP